MSVPNFPIGTRYLPNNIAVMLQKYAGRLLASNHISLNGTTQSVPYPVLHTLAADSKKIATSVDAGWTDNANNTYTGSTVTGDIVGVSTDISGVVKVTITLSSVTAGDVEGYAADGTYTFEETLSASLNLTGTGFTGIVEVVSVEAITMPTASYLTLLQADGTIKQYSADGDSGSTLAVSTIHSETASHQFVFNSTSPLSAADVATIEADPNLAFRMFFDGEVLHSGFSRAIDMINCDFYGGNGGLLAEEHEPNLRYDSADIEATNELSHSDDLSTNWNNLDSFWTTTHNSADILEPDGGNTASKKVAINTSKSALCLRKQVELSLTSGLEYASSMWIYVPSITGVTSWNINTDYNDADAITGKSIYTFNQWVRVFTATTISAARTQLDFNIRPNDTTIIPDDFTFYLWHPQTENSPLPTDFISTEGIPVTRTGVPFSDAYAKIQAYDTATRTTLANQGNGATGLKLIKDGSGRTTGTAPENTLSHTSDGHADTEWMPNISKYTIKETITGNLAILDAAGVPTGSFSVRTETRVLTHEDGVADNLYIDTVLQPYTPSLPNPLETVRLGQTAVIGYADTITSRSDGFSVKAIVSVP